VIEVQEESAKSNCLNLRGCMAQFENWAAGEKSIESGKAVSSCTPTFFLLHPTRLRKDKNVPI